jgi:hypothetical protein
MRKLIMLAAVFMAALTAVPAFASVQNVKVGGSINSTYLSRKNFDLGINAIGDETQNVFLTQTMLHVDADLTDQVSTAVCLINERAWSQKDSVADDSDIDLHLAYVTLREMLYSPLTVVAGRQAFHYGNSFIIDAGGTNNSAPTDSGIRTIAGDLTLQTAMDAVRFIFDYSPLTLEFLYSKVNANTVTAVADDRDDVDLYGANATYKLGDEMDTQVETYFFAKVDKSTAGNAANGGPTGESSKSDTVYVPGLRVSTTPLEGLNLSTELAWQRGNRVASSATTIDDNQAREALGAQFIANYQLPVAKEYSPAAQYVYTYVSGDSNPDDRRAATEASSNKYSGWDPMFENQGGGRIWNAIFNLSNAHINVASLQANPIQDVMTKVSWTGLWLDKKLKSNSTSHALVQPDGTATGAYSFNSGKTEIGQEVDVDATYAYTEDVSFGASLGWFLPGDFFAAANESVASQALLSGNVNF